MSKKNSIDEDDKEEENFFSKNNNKDKKINNNTIELDEDEEERKLAGKKDIIEPEEKEKDKEFVSYKKYYESSARDPGKEGRKASRIIFLRSFNNWVKASLINKYCRKLGRGLSILELCCGKGGDLDKYFMNQIKLFVGADISSESLKNAMNRLEKIKNEKYSKNFEVKCIFIKEDLSHPENRFLEKFDKKYYFDLVSCQFALHYHFENEKRLNAFLINASSRLCEGGYFIGTVVDDNVIVKRLRNRKNIPENKYIKEKFTFGNEYYSVKFSQKHFNKSDGPYGIKYGFYLEDSIDNRDEQGNIKYVEEYLIVFNEFVELCKKYDLYLVEKENFTKFYSDYTKIDHYKKLSNKMLKFPNSSNMNQQWEIIQLYMVFVFRKGKENNSKEKYTPYLAKSGIKFNNYKPELMEGTFD